MTREEQLRLMRHDAPLALNRVAAMIETYRADIIAAAEARVDAGYDLYGITSWQKTPYELDAETVEELADAIAYQVMARHRRRHPHP